MSASPAETEARTYVGSELELFASATLWKRYLRRAIGPYLGPAVLEVGAGLGGTTRFLCDGAAERWVCLEPDPALAARLRAARSERTIPAACEVAEGTLAAIAPDRPFDTLLYIDVLEHIADDRAELERAAPLVKPGGYVVVVAPAHRWLLSPFDRAVGHFRRYTRRSLPVPAADSGLELVGCRYLDSVGLAASLVNRLVLRTAAPKRWQVFLWDKMMVPLSRGLDPLFGYRLGKSLLAVWKKADRPATAETAPA